MVAKGLKSFFINNRLILIIIGGVIVLAAIGYGAYFSYKTHKKLQATQVELASSTLAFQKSLDQLEAAYTALGKENADMRGLLSNEQKTNLDLQVQKQTNEAQISTLTKLTTIDPELLEKYSKVFFLSENYVPAGLANIDQKYDGTPGTQWQILDKVAPFLNHMLEDVNASGVPLSIASAYRSFGTQSALKAQYTMTYGAGTANSFSADQGYSEHQLGTALDFTTPTIKGAYPAFEQSTAYAWLNQNAYKYGFVISYPKNNNYYEYEPWHWRFVGVALATSLHDNNQFFYQMDQRTIDTYLVKLFDQN